MGNTCCVRDKNANLELVPDTPAVTAEWLTEALRRAGRLTAAQRVTSLEMGHIAAAAGDGTAAENGGGMAGGSIVRITDITYDGVDVDSSAHVLPRVLVHKWCSARDVLQSLTLKERMVAGTLFHLDNYYGIRTEYAVYSSVADQLRSAGVATPTAYYAALDDPTGTDASLCCAVCCPRRANLRSSILFEDMGERGFTAGMATSGPRLSQQHAVAAVKTMARIHAWGWGGRGRGQKESKWTALLSGQYRPSHMLFKSFGTDTSLQSFLDTWSSRDHAADLRCEELRQMLWDLRNNFENWFERGCKMPREQTLLHGDFHLGNIFVRKDGMASPDDISLIDWAYLGTYLTTIDVLICCVLLGKHR